MVGPLFERSSIAAATAVGVPAIVPSSRNQQFIAKSMPSVFRSSWIPVTIRCRAMEKRRGPRGSPCCAPFRDSIISWCSLFETISSVGCS